MSHALRPYNTQGLTLDSNRNTKGDYLIQTNEEGRTTSAYYFLLSTMDDKEYILSPGERDALVDQLSSANTKFITLRRYDLTLPAHQVKSITKESEGIWYCPDGDTTARTPHLGSALTLWPEADIHYYLPKGEVTWPVYA